MFVPGESDGQSRPGVDCFVAAILESWSCIFGLETSVLTQFPWGTTPRLLGEREAPALLSQSGHRRPRRQADRKALLDSSHNNLEFTWLRTPA